MLAQAELQRAQEMEEGLAQRRWLRRLLPAGAAAVVAAFVWGVWVSVPPPLVDRPPIMTAAEREGSSSAPVPAAAAAPVAIAPPPRSTDDGGDFPRRGRTIVGGSADKREDGKDGAAASAVRPDSFTGYAKADERGGPKPAGAVNIFLGNRARDYRSLKQNGRFWEV